MNTMPFVPSQHYNMVSQWWTTHKFGVIPLSHLPSSGLVVNDGGAPLMAGFLYLSDSEIAWIEFIVSNPWAGIKAKSQALDLIISDLCALAKEKKRSCIFTSSTNDRLIARFTDQGFKVGDTKITQLMRFESWQ